MTSRTLGQPDVHLDDVYTASSGPVLMTGIQALVRLTLDQRRLDLARGLNTGLFVSGYEGSPLGGLDLALEGARSHLDPAGVVFRPGVNEELAATAVAGTQSLGSFPGRRFDGVTGCWYGKSPGLDRAADAIRHGNLTGTSPLGGAVAWIGDDPASKSSTVPSSSVAMCRSLTVPVLVPGTVEEILTLGLHAIAMSRHAGLWVGMLINSDVADASSTVDLDRVMRSVTTVDLPVREGFVPWMMIPPRNLDAELDLMTTRLARATDYVKLSELNAITFEPDSARIALVGSGLGYQAIIRALHDLGIDESARQRLGLRLVRLSAPWPVDAADVSRLFSGVETVLVVEDKLPFIEGLLRDSLYRSPGAPLVLGKKAADGRPLLPVRGFVDADDVARAVGRIVDAQLLPASAHERLKALKNRRVKIELAPSANRTPYFCSGCPHNISTRASADQLVGLGIGCHTLAGMDGGNRRGTLTGITQMGGEGAQWLGIAPFTDDAHFIQNVGDGTFHHSGSLAIRAAVAARVTMTYKLLYNDAVAMTGGQQPQGKMDVPTVIQLLAAEGVARVIVTTPEPQRYARIELPSIAQVRHRDDLQEAVRELETIPGVTVLIHDDRCANEKRRLRKRGTLENPPERVVINERVCEGCGDCGEQSTCLSLVPVSTEFGRKTQVHQSSCNVDMSCLKGDCPSFLLVTPKRSDQPRPASDIVPPEHFPEVLWRVPEDVLVRLPGVGGTGVVTIAAILRMAAHLDGRYSGGLDQTGLAQKGGAVVSDVRFGPSPIEGQLRASARSADVIIGLDLFGASSDETLAVTDANRTIAVLSSSVIPTASMVTDVHSSWVPAEDAAARVDAATRCRENLRVDAESLADHLFGHHMAANMILLGAAYQHGCLPIGEGAIEQAIRLNGTALEMNLRAFAWGRAAVAHPALVDAAMSPAAIESPTTDALVLRRVEQVGLTGALGERVAIRYTELVAYQHRRYADRYLGEVVEVLEKERSCVGADSTAVAIAFAEGLYKLMAYKDEYEVARLHLSEVERKRIRSEFGEARVKVLLHPPTLRAIGLKRKLRLGRSGFAAFRILRRMRRLRGTRFDPFGRSKLRGVERELIVEYRELVHRALADLDHSNVAEVVAVAELPDVVRGYEHVKLANIERFRTRAEGMLREIADLASSRATDSRH